MSQPNRTSQGGIPPFLPGVILIGTFAFMMVILAPRPDSAISPLSQRTPTAITILPTATLSIPTTPVPATAEINAPAATPGNVLTAIAVGAGPQAVTSAPSQPDTVGTPLLVSTTSSTDSASPAVQPTAGPGNVLTAIAVGAGPEAVTSVPTQHSESGAVTSPTPSAVVVTEVAAVPPTESVPAAAVVVDPALADQGSMLFQSSCAACHGFDAHGIPGLGKDLVTSAFVHGLSDADLLQFIIIGREASDPLNTTGIMMPARGGNATLTDDQLLAIIAYLRSIATPG